ncbi:TPA: DNA cytosine methyltransferase [Enterococcus faecium]|nr:DNA cytosine methyltransferase [Enterococcus faecium]
MSEGEREVEQLSLLEDFNQKEDVISFFLKNRGYKPDVFGEVLHKYFKKSKLKINTLSLFSGAGGLDIGFRDAGFNIVEQVEFEKVFSQTLNENSEGSHVVCKDIRNYDSKHLIGNVDFIIGGPPCQSFSAAGRRAEGARGTNDDRGMLFNEYVRILKNLQPKGFLFENVYGIVSSNNGEDWKLIVKSFEAVGYKLFYRILDAADYGVPQHRERLIIVGLKESNFLFPRPTHGRDSITKIPYYSAENAISDIQVHPTEKNGINGQYGHLLSEIPPGLNYSFYTAKMGNPKPVFAWRSKFSDFLYKADPERPVRTIKANGGQYTGPFHWENRKFSISELKRLQTFPDEYQISGTNRMIEKQIGNSVPPQFARIMALSVRDQIFDSIFNEKEREAFYLLPKEELTFRKHKRELTKIYQDKAKKQIEKMKLVENNFDYTYTREYYANISSKFEYKSVEKKDAMFYIFAEYKEKNLSKIILKDVKSRTKKNNLEISVKIRDSNSIQDFTEVQLFMNSKQKLAYTALWKAFENELKKNYHKADLIQLNGYYQYLPNFIIEIEKFSDFVLEEKFLQSVLSNEVTAQMRSTSEFCKLWNVSPDEFIEKMKLLKDLGYEVRNTNTNGQIPLDNWLIPYAFPTLTNKSVQTYKEL